MSNTIETKVVELQFDNRNFEKNTAQSMETIDELNKSLAFSDAKKGFKQLDDAANAVKMSGLSDSVETVKLKFNAMTTIATAALGKITTQAIDAGEQLVKALTVDPIAAGLDKYTEKTGSVQSILNSTDLTIDEVNEKLSKLQWYSDETSYSFTDMTSALSTMLSSSDVNINEAITMIEGMANATSFAGKGAAQFGSVIRNLTQSYSMGYLNLMDWKSIELQNVNSKQLIKSLIAVGEEMGTIEKGQVTIENFRDSLSEGWATQEVMVKAFGKWAAYTDEVYDKYSDPSNAKTTSEIMEDMTWAGDEFAESAMKAAQEAKSWEEAVDATKDAVSSGWAETFEAIFGNYEESKVWWTDITNAMYDLFMTGTEYRNEVLNAWKYDATGGREALLEGFWATYDGIGFVVKMIKDTFVDVFDIPSAEEAAKKLAEVVNKFVVGARNFKAFMMSATYEGSNLRKFVEGIASVIRFVANTIKQVFKGIIAPQHTLFVSLGKVFSVLGSIGEFLTWLSGYLGQFKAIQKWLGTIKNDILLPIVSMVLTIGRTLATLFKTILGAGGPQVEKTATIINALINAINFGLRGIGKVVQFIAPLIEKTINLIAKGLGSAISYVVSFGQNSKEIFSAIGASLETLKNKFVSAFKAIRNKVIAPTIDLLQPFVDMFKTAGKAIADFFSSFGKGAADAAVNTFNRIGIGLDKITTKLIEPKEAVSELENNFIEFKEIVTDGAMVKELDTVSVKMRAIAKTSKQSLDSVKKYGIKQTEQTGKTIAGITKEQYAALKDHVKSAADMSSVDTELESSLGKVKHRLSAFEEWLAGVWDGIKIFFSAIAETIETGKWNDFIDILKFVLKILVAKDISKIFNPFEGLSNGLESMGKTLERFAPSKTKNFTAALKTIASSLLMVAAALYVLSLIDDDKLDDAKKVMLVMIGAISAALVGFAALSKKMENGISLKSSIKMTGMILTLAIAVNIISKALKSIAKATDDPAILATASAAMIAIVVALMTAMRSMFKIINKAGGNSVKDAKALKLMSASFKAMAQALLIVAISMRVLAGVKNPMSLVAAAVAIGAVLFALVAAVKKLQDVAGGKAVAGAAAMAIMSVALLTLVPVILIYSAIKWETFGKGMATIAIALAVLTVALNHLQTKALVGALALVVVSNGLLLMAAVIAIFGKMKMETIVKGILSVITILGSLIVIGAVAGLLSPLLLHAATAFFVFAAGVSLLCLSITPLVLVISILVGWFMTLAAAGVAAGAALGTTLGAAVAAFLAAITGIGGLIAAIIGDFVKSLIDMLIDLIQTEVPKIISSLLETALESLNIALTYAAPIVSTLMELIITVLQEIAKRVGELGQYIGLIIANFVTGFMNAIRSVDPNLFLDLLQLLLTTRQIFACLALIGAMGGAAVIGVTAIAAVLAEVAALMKIPGVADFLFSGIKEIVLQLGEAFKIFDEKTKDIDPDGAESAKAISEALVNIAEALLKDAIANTFFHKGAKSFKEFGQQLTDFGECMVDYNDIVSGNIDKDAIQASADASDILVTMADKFPRTGGFIQKIFGEVDLGKFGIQLVTFGKAIVAFSEEVKDSVDGDAVDAAAKAGTVMATLAKDIPASGGILQDFFGAQDLGAFGSQMRSYGTFIVGFSRVLTEGGIDDVAIARAAASGQIMAALANNIPRFTGNSFMGAIFGDNDLKTFGSQLLDYGYSIIKFAGIVSGLTDSDVTSVENAAAMGSRIVEMCSLLPEGVSVSALWGMIKVDVGANFDKFASAMPNLGSGISAFVTNVQGMPSNTSVAESAAKVGTALAEMCSYIPKDSSVSVMWGWFKTNETVNYQKFAEAMPSLGTGIRDFMDNIAGGSYDVDTAQAAAKVGTALAEMSAAIPTEGGFNNLINGTSDYTKFAEAMPDLATGITTFINNTLGLSDTDISKAQSAAQVGLTLATMANDISQSGKRKWYEFFEDTPKTSWGLFKDYIPVFGVAINKFCTSMPGHGYIDRATTGAEIATTITDMLIKIGQSNLDLSAVNFIVGSGSDVTLASVLTTLGEAISVFGTTTKGVSLDDVDHAIAAATSIINMSTGEATLNAEYFESMEAIKDTTAIESVLDLVKMFSDKAKEIGIDSIDLTDTISKIKSLVFMIQDVNAAVSIINPYSNETRVDSFSKSIVKMGESVATFNDTVGDIDSDTLTQRISNMQSWVDSMESIGSKGVYEFIEAFDSEKETAKDKVDEFGKACAEAIVGSAAINTAKKEAKLIISNFEGEFTEAKRSFANRTTIYQNPVIAYTNSVLDTIDLKAEAKTSAVNLIDGFYEGIESEEGTVYSKITEFAKKVLSTLNKGLDEASPSRATAKSGRYFAEGFTNGLIAGSKDSMLAVEDIADGSLSIMNLAVKSISRLISEGIDSEPTIRPVMDLTELEQGARSINSMRLNPTLSAATTGTIASRWNTMGAAVDNSQSNNYQQAVTNTFNINGAQDPQAVANEVSKILQNQVERRNASWA